jgi:hypothetical protein
MAASLLAAAWLGQALPPPPPPPAVIPPPPVAPARAARAPARPAPAVDPVVLRALFAADPPLEPLRRAASTLAAAEPARARSLVHRARWAALLPELRVRVDRRLGRTESVDLGGSATETTVAPVGVDTINDLRYECRATWDLSRLVFNPDELGAESQALRMADVRREVESLVIRLYFERRRLKAEAVASDATDMALRIRLDLRIEELEAELDALTGGAFSRLRASRGGDASFADP